MILRHESALDRAMARKARMLPSLGKEFPAGKMRVTATAQDMTPGWRTSARSWESTFRLGTLAMHRYSNFKN
jgi:hypothetical protein